MRLAELPTGEHLIESGLVSARELGLLEKELERPDPELEGRCPLDAERLRSGDAVEAYGAWLYVLVRALEPLVVVETGVQNGCSTELILWAVHRNGRGRLFSIDSGPTSSDGSHQTRAFQTTDGAPGKDILEGLKEHWDLTIGLSGEHLAPACERAGELVDLFWHDSDHSEENVKFEFSAVKHYVRPGGLLCLHDYHGQDVTLGAPVYRLIVPLKEPYLRVWQKESEDRGGCPQAARKYKGPDSG